MNNGQGASPSNTTGIKGLTEPMDTTHLTGTASSRKVRLPRLVARSHASCHGGNSSHSGDR